MNTDKIVQHIESLIEKATQSDSADSAMKFTQAATNAANAMTAIMYLRQQANSTTQSGT